MRLLEEKGAAVSYNDPHIPEIRPGRTHHDVAGRQSVAIDIPCDVIVICTAHNAYKNIDFAKLNRPIVDCRNMVERGLPMAYRA
jgi:UDP-N-acetyl-D-glucosamine dehydrogenase